MPAAITQPSQYAGYYVHSRSGLNLTRTRDYSANLGRFISRDPIEEEGGLNLYAYVDNDPINLIDPDGLFPGQRPPGSPGGPTMCILGGCCARAPRNRPPRH